MQRFYLWSAVSVLAAVAWGGETQSAGKTTTFKGYFETGVNLMDGNVLRPVPVFVDPDRAAVVPAAECEKARAILKDVCTNCAELERMPARIRSIRAAMGNEQESKFKDMAHILVFPTKDVTMKKFRNARCFEAGATKQLHEVVQKYGAPEETQVFPAKELQSWLAFDGTVSWWGYVGLAASRKGGITHIFLREQAASEK